MREIFWGFSCLIEILFRHLTMTKNKLDKIVMHMDLYFGAKVVGSYLLYKHEGMDSNLLNNVNFIVSEERIEGVRAYLVDAGYKEELIEGVARASATLKYEHTGIFLGKDRLPIHVDVQENLTVHPTSRIIATRFSRGTLEDFLALAQIIDRKLMELTKNS